VDEGLDGINIDKDEKVAIRMPIVINDTIYYGTCISMGNPHVIIFVDKTDDYPLEKTGPSFESYRNFPERINTEFVQVVDRTHVKMRVWERGTGETLACGTGASATAVACVLNGKTEDEITVSLLGGDLRIRWDREQNLVFMTGPATTVFEGEI
jgi:diaminopimelate epimerase